MALTEYPDLCVVYDETRSTQTIKCLECDEVLTTSRLVNIGDPPPFKAAIDEHLAKKHRPRP